MEWTGIFQPLFGIFQPLFGSELYKWERLIFSLGLMDLWHVSSFERMQYSLPYSCQNRKNQIPICLGQIEFTRINFCGTKEAQSEFYLHFPFLIMHQHRTSRFKIPTHVFLRQDCAPSVHNMWNKYDYSYDYALSSVQNAVVPFGSGSLRESGGNHQGFGLGEIRIRNRASNEQVKREVRYNSRESYEYSV